MARTITDVENSVNNFYSAYQTACASGTASGAELVVAQGRYMRALRAAIKWCDNNGHPSGAFQSRLDTEMPLRNNYLRMANRENRRSDYCIVKRLGIGIENGIASIVHGTRQTVSAKDNAERLEGAKEIGRGIGRTVSSVIKAPINVVTYVMSTRLFTGILMMPLRFMGGVFHAAWHVHDTVKPKYEGRRIDKWSRGVNRALTMLNERVRRL